MNRDLDLIIAPGVMRLYRLALIDGDAFIPLSEHDTAEQALDAKDHARAAAADAVIALRECVS